MVEKCFAICNAIGEATHLQKPGNISALARVSLAKYKFYCRSRLQANGALALEKLVPALPSTQPHKQIK